MNLIGNWDYALKLIRAFQIRGERNPAPTLTPEITPVVIVEDLTTLDFERDSSFIDYVGTTTLDPGVGNIGQLVLNLSDNEFTIIEVRRVILSHQLGAATTDFALWLGDSNIQGIQVPISRVVERDVHPGLGGSQSFLTNRLTSTILTVGTPPGTVRICTVGATGSGAVVLESTGAPIAAFGPRHAFIMTTLTGDSPAHFTIWWRERPLRRVGAY